MQLFDCAKFIFPDNSLPKNILIMPEADLRHMKWFSG